MSRIEMHSRISKWHLAPYGRTEPFKRIYLGGTFDCLHHGHLELFRNAQSVALEVVVGLNTDEFATAYKREPLQKFRDRFEVLAHCDLIDTLLINEGGPDSRSTIARSGADAIGHGSDWTGEGLMRQMGFDQKWLNDHRIQMVYLPYTTGISSSDIIRRARTLVLDNGSGQ